MAASHLRLILTDVLTVLRADLGDYNLSTVSGTHKVQLGEGIAPPIRPPFVWVAGPTLVSSNESPLTEVHKAGTIRWRAFAPTAALTTESRIYAALDIGEQITNALEDAHANPARATIFGLTTWLVDIVDVFSDGPDIPDGNAWVDGVIRYTTDRLRGG